MDTIASADGTVIAFDQQSPPFLRNATQAAAERMANGRLAVLPGQSHDLNPDATAPVMAEFLAS